MKEILNEIELIKGQDNYNALFHIDTNSIIRINDFTFQLLESIKNNEEIDFSEIDIDKEVIENFLTQIKNVTDKKEKISGREVTKEIDRITLMISNDCNLNCTYCYGDGGNYNKEKKLMTKETAKYIVDFFVKNEYKINSIVFFGGEPLLNLPVMKFICDYYSELKRENKVTKIPSYGMITNGTIINDQILEVIDQYQIGITVSLDGPKEINDKSRIFNDGRGSFDLIDKFIRTIKSKADRRLTAECTVTEEHEKLGYDEKNLTEFFKKEFDIHSVIVPELSLEKKSAHIKKNYSYINDFFNKDTDSLEEANNGILSSLYYLTHNIQCENCRIGEKMLAISADGEIFPCHMNAAYEKTNLGSIFDDNIFNQPEKLIKENSYLNVVRKLEGECGNCWVKNLCVGCSVKKFFDKDKEEYRLTPDKLMCNDTKEYFRILIKNVLLTQSKPEVWAKFVEKINRAELAEQECV